MMLTTKTTVLSLFAVVSAAPTGTSTPTATPTSTALPSGTTIRITQQLNRSETATQVNAYIDVVATQRSSNNIIEAGVLQVGPWCAGFSDAEAQHVVRSVNFEGDGIFNSERSAKYGDAQVFIGSYYCANTRQEVVDYIGA